MDELHNLTKNIWYEEFNREFDNDFLNEIQKINKFNLNRINKYD
jgi:hypothetical protein